MHLNNCLQYENVMLLEEADSLSDAALDIQPLQQCMTDLDNVLAFPATWRGREPVEILSSLADSLMGMLGLDFLYVRGVVEADKKPLEVLRAGPSQGTDEIARSLGAWLKEDPTNGPAETRRRIGSREISIFPLRMGVEDDLGLLIAGSEELGFPEQTERLVLRVAANQAAAALQRVLFLSEQKRVANELDRRVAERTRELVEANDELQLQAGLLQHLPVSAWTLRPDGTPDFVNQVWLDFSGQTLDFVRSHPEAWMTAVHPEDRETAARNFWEGVRSGQDFAVETRSLRAQDGTYRWHLQQAVVLRDAEGKVLKFVGTTTDIDDQKRADEKLRRSEEFLVQGQHLSSTCSFSFSEHFGAEDMEWSEETYRIFEIDRSTPITMDLILSRIHPEDVWLIHEMMSRTRAGEDKEHEFEHRLVMPDKTVKYVRMVSHGIRGENGGRVRIATVQDVTERRLAEEALNNVRSELARMMRAMTIGQLTASIAHEVSQPLSGIITNASTCLRMLKTEPPNIDGARETAQRTIRDSKRATEVVSRLRALFGKKKVAAEPMDLNEAIREVIALSLSDLQRHQIILQLEFADGLPLLNGDRIQLQQVVLNLLRNALEAMDGVEDRPRRLLIRTEQQEEEIRLMVRDSGVGLAPTDAERLFESFYTTKEDGMGIGLSISRSIIEAHHGRLWATADGGPGATFAFSIPCERTS